ncbi:hypothetical protein DFH08DRAFT_995227 [Mycena albidolilacea]|uniref:Endonuclease/exonuclease/phosphatase domain-containing protein n=1 Tax=Mycena albidolilacea TaxID=1033008 RepID=A0AAD7EVH1_9AGAR|nr:hypothetical protein DFH08DRAFT_995227 [Mycena albidolilacea]
MKDVHYIAFISLAARSPIPDTETLSGASTMIDVRSKKLNLTLDKQLFESDHHPRICHPNHPRPRRPINSPINHARSEKGHWLPGTIPSASTLVHSTYELYLLTWNVDFAVPLVVRRFQTALSHLEKLVSPHLTSPPPPPTIILLQEVHTSCFKTVLTNTFICEFAQITNLLSARSYSTLTLVPNSLAFLVFSASRVPFTETRMQRDCIVVRRPRHSAAPDGWGAESEKHYRQYSLGVLERVRGQGRPKQLEVILRPLTTSEVDAGLVAGDMNAISPSDRNLPEEVGLSDAWLTGTAQPTECGTKNVDEAGLGKAEGHTWGYQPK